jgi:hypothetical protein
MSFVDFMIIGAQKSGTTTFSKILSSHPNVCFSREKEPHFFSKSPNWQKFIEVYKALYQPKDKQICGEASTTYTCYPEFNKNIWHSLYEFNPNLKFIELSEWNPPSDSGQTHLNPVTLAQQGLHFLVTKLNNG